MTASQHRAISALQQHLRNPNTDCRIAVAPGSGVAIARQRFQRPGKLDFREDRVLLIDASNLGKRRPGRTELTDADIAAVATSFRAWQDRGDLAGSRVRAALLPVASLLVAEGNLNPARWIGDSPDEPDQLPVDVTAGMAITRAPISTPSA
jgi:type I restriction-modification system DNA methylase subunit